MSGLEQLSRNVPIIVRFEGGVKDGVELRTDEPESMNDANMIWSLTRKGVLGSRFDWYEPDCSNHRYKVVEKLGTTEAIIVTCKYTGAGKSPIK